MSLRSLCLFPSVLAVLIVTAGAQEAGVPANLEIGAYKTPIEYIRFPLDRPLSGLDSNHRARQPSFPEPFLGALQARLRSRHFQLVIRELQTERVARPDAERIEHLRGNENAAVFPDLHLCFQLHDCPFASILTV